jgi:hypothetical protein
MSSHGRSGGALIRPQHRNLISKAMRHVDEIKNVMEAVAARIVALVEGRPAAGGKVVPLY